MVYERKPFNMRLSDVKIESRVVHTQHKLYLTAHLFYFTLASELSVQLGGG